MHSIHYYTACNDAVKNALAPRFAERAIEIYSALIDLERIENGVSPSVPRPNLCFDECNAWGLERAPGDTGVEKIYTLSDGWTIGIRVARPAYNDETKPAWMKGTLVDIPFLDVSATSSEDGWTNLVVVKPPRVR